MDDDTTQDDAVAQAMQKRRKRMISKKLLRESLEDMGLTVMLPIQTEDGPSGDRDFPRMQVTLYAHELLDKFTELTDQVVRLSHNMYMWKARAEDAEQRLDDWRADIQDGLWDRG
jgi:hypothetical protein